MPTRFELANAIRALAMDAVQKAGNGHPGTPMGMADIAQVLWGDFMHHDPADPHWCDRDRFVLSNGHGSMLLYSLLHLTGYDLSIDDLRHFRQLKSRTPGHPEYRLTPGVETTTGPLGQGLATSIGMALGEQLLALEFNTSEHTIVDHHTYVFCGDGCLMEGVSHEACSLAGTLGLGKLIVFYDDNSISIDGDVHGWFLDDTASRFEAYHWQVVRNVNGHDPDEIKKALETARSQHERPTLIQCKTIIGFGAPNKQGTESAHGEALGAEEIKLAREKLGWPYPAFEIPAEIRNAWDARAKGRELHQAWQKRFDAYSAAHPDKAAEFKRRLAGHLPADWPKVAAALLEEARKPAKPVATRKSSESVLNHVGPALPELVGGSADLTKSNNTLWKGAKTAHVPVREFANYFHFGVREFGMVTLLSGLSLHGGYIPYGGTFLVFSDYARNGIRLASLMKLRVVYVFTHDSIGLGEDGPTHQPIEHLSSLRAMPFLHVWRPADAFETAVAWKAGLERTEGPALLALSRQNLTQQDHPAEHAAGAARGAYVVWEAPQWKAILIATGSEVDLAVKAAQLLQGEGVAVRVVSMPCMEVFREQPAEYREQVLPAGAKARLSVEAGASMCWHEWVGDAGRSLAIDHFGESAPINDVYRELGYTVEGIGKRVKELIAATKQ